MIDVDTDNCYGCCLSVILYYLCLISEIYSVAGEREENEDDCHIDCYTTSQKLVNQRIKDTDSMQGKEQVYLEGMEAGLRSSCEKMGTDSWTGQR